MPFSKLYRVSSLSGDNDKAHPTGLRENKSKTTANRPSDYRPKHTSRRHTTLDLVELLQTVD